MKKFLTTITFILVIVLLVGCGSTQGNITKDVVNNTINQIDNIVTTVNSLGTPNEENIKLEQNYQDSNNDIATYNNTRKPQETSEHRSDVFFFIIKNFAEQKWAKE